MVRLERLTDKNSEYYIKALELYQISFPYHEKRERKSQDLILEDKDYFFYLIFDDSLFIGIVLCWERDGYIYIEHLAILPEYRNKHYGTKVLDSLKEQEKIVILEIDPPVDDISIHRKNFYLRCGFMVNSYKHIHPPYHRDCFGHELVVLSYPREITEDEYATFNGFLSTHIMKDVY